MAQSDRADRFLKRICQRVSIRSNARKVCPKVEAIRQRISVMANHSLRRIKAVPPLPPPPERLSQTKFYRRERILFQSVRSSPLPLPFLRWYGFDSRLEGGGEGEGFLVSEQRGLNRWG